MAEEANNENIFLRKAKAVFTMKSIRFALLGIISALIVQALLMVILGNIAYYHYYHYAYFYTDTAMGKYVTPSILCIAIGSVLFVVSGFGCYGSLKKSTCVVNTYGAFLSLLFKLQLTGLGLVYSFDRGAIWIDFSIPVWGIADAGIRKEVDFIQSSLQCCGNAYFTDYANMEFPSDMATVKVSVDQKILVMPASCCVKSALNGGYCANVWQSGCKYKLLHNMEQNVIMVGVVFVCAMVITLLGMIFAFLLARSIRNMKSETALLRWRIQEETIMGRVSEEAGPSQLETDPTLVDAAPTQIEPCSSQIETASSQIAPGSIQIEAGSNQIEISPSLPDDSPTGKIEDSSRNFEEGSRKQQANHIKLEDITTSEV